MACYRRSIARLHGKRVAAASLVVKSSRAKYHTAYIAYHKSVRVRRAQLKTIRRLRRKQFRFLNAVRRLKFGLKRKRY
jgi:hypothetical protein